MGVGSGREGGQGKSLAANPAVSVARVRRRGAYGLVPELGGSPAGAARRPR
jgi:hypothetical protein